MCGRVLFWLIYLCLKSLIEIELSTFSESVKSENKIYLDNTGVPREDHHRFSHIYYTYFAN